MGRHTWRWYPWLTKGVATVHCTAVVMAFMFLWRVGYGSLGERTQYIVSNETAIRWSWGVGAVAILLTTVVFLFLLISLNQRYRAVLQMGLLIWILGVSATILHDFLQMTVIPALSQLFVQVPTKGLAQTITDWEQMLIRLLGVFAWTCYGIGGLIYTGVMFRTEDFPEHLAWLSLFVWSLLLLLSIVLSWISSKMIGFTSFSLLIFIPWLWRAGQAVRPTPVPKN